MDVKISQLTKTYPGGIQALRGVNLEIGTGTFGLLGSNGAGKTTLLRILATLLKPSQGRVTVDGFDVSDRRQKWAVKQILGYLPEELGFYPSLSVSEFLDYIATLKNLHHPQTRARAVEQVVEQAGLRSVTRQRIGTLSGGMKRRGGIAPAPPGGPKLRYVEETTPRLGPERRGGLCHPAVGTETAVGVDRDRGDRRIWDQDHRPGGRSRRTPAEAPRWLAR